MTTDTPSLPHEGRVGRGRLLTVCVVLCALIVVPLVSWMRRPAPRSLPAGWTPGCAESGESWTALPGATFPAVASDWRFSEKRAAIVWHAGTVRSESEHEAYLDDGHRIPIDDSTLSYLFTLTDRYAAYLSEEDGITSLHRIPLDTLTSMPPVALEPSPLRRDEHFKLRDWCWLDWDVTHLLLWSREDVPKSGSQAGLIVRLCDLETGTLGASQPVPLQQWEVVARSTENPEAILLSSYATPRSWMTFDLTTRLLTPVPRPFNQALTVPVLAGSQTSWTSAPSKVPYVRYVSARSIPAGYLDNTMSYASPESPIGLVTEAYATLPSYRLWSRMPAQLQASRTADYWSVRNSLAIEAIDGIDAVRSGDAWWIWGRDAQVQQMRVPQAMEVAYQYSIEAGEAHPLRLLFRSPEQALVLQTVAPSPSLAGHPTGLIRLGVLSDQLPPQVDWLGYWPLPARARGDHPGFIVECEFVGASAWMGLVSGAEGNNGWRFNRAFALRIPDFDAWIDARLADPATVSP